MSRYDELMLIEDIKQILISDDNVSVYSCALAKTTYYNYLM